MPRYKRSSADHKNNLEKMHWGMLARLYAPQSVLISQDYKVIHATDGIDKYLKYSGGEPSRNILNMIRPEIQQNIRSLLFRLKNEDSHTAKKKIQIKADGKQHKLELIARRFSDKDFPEGLIHIVFREITEEKKKAFESTHRKSENEPSGDKSEIIESLERELEYTKEQLQLSVEEYETSNEELRASNEELQSMNEELQSTAEELETSQEELQSVNEELKTVNEQLESKLDELSRAHSDLENLMEATEVGIIFVDRELCIQRFTSTSADIFNLIASDKGRPLEHITHSLEHDELLEDIRQVLDNLQKTKRVVKTKTGRWYIMRIRPYRSSEDKIEGVLLSFTEFTELKEAREIIEDQQYQESLAMLGVYALEQDDLEMIMHRAIQQSCALLDLKCAAVMMLDDEKNIFNVVSESGCGCGDLEVENDEKWDIGFTLASNKPVSVFNYKEEKRFKISPLMAHADFVSSAHITIRGAEKVFGVFAVYSQDEREFTKQDLHFIQVVANILGRSMEQKMFQNEILDKNEQLQKEMERTRQIKREIIDNNVLERWELGGYLHDNFGQFLASVKILVDDIRYKIAKNQEADVTAELDEINRIMDECITGIRDVIHDIIPIDVEEEGVAQAFRVVMNQTFKMYDVRCILENDDVLNQIKNRKVATHLYYIVQEAFKNAATHGQASLIVISARKENDQFTLQVKDDGIGISATKKGKGKGIRIMKHRMDLLGGSLKIEDNPVEEQSGTVVSCTLPLDKLKRDDHPR